MRIWLGTWNVEQSFPSMAQLNTWVNHSSAAPAFGPGTCDIIVMGFQECSRNHAMPAIGGFNPVNHLTANGQTKNQENCQAMFVWHRAAGGGAINNVGQQLLVTPRTFKRKVKFWAEYGKGSANNILWYTPPGAGAAAPWGIVISSAHLDSKSPVKRTLQLNAIVNSAPNLALGAAWDVQFLMGDLNFRVNKTVNRLLAHFCNQVAINRAVLFADDSLRNDPVIGANAGGGWVFPDPVDGQPGANLTLPTYKKHYHPIAAANAAVVAVGALPANPTVNVPLVYEIEVDHNGAVMAGSRPGQYDLGWLDRIGYRVSAGSARVVNHRYSGSLPDLIVSDHSPVYSIFDIV